MVRKEWQEKASTEAHDRLKKTLIEAKKGMTKTELHKATGLARTTIDRHLQALENTKQVQKYWNRYVWGDKYTALVRGLKEDAALVEELDVLVDRAKEIINKMLLPTNLLKWRREGEFELSEEVFERGYVTAEELTKMMDQKEKVFGGLRRVFTSLAKVLMRADVAIKPFTAEEDLSNVEVHFINEEPSWTVLPEALMRKNKPLT